MVTKRLPARRRPKQTKIPPGPKREDYDNIWDWIVAMGESIPKEVQDTIPHDGSINLEHYLYGAPKRSR